MLDLPFRFCVACYTHQRNTRNNNWVERFVDFVRRRKLNKTDES